METMDVVYVVLGLITVKIVYSVVSRLVALFFTVLIMAGLAAFFFSDQTFSYIFKQVSVFKFW